jgi:hypothetical protein
MAELTFNPLFDYKGIARNALEGVGLDPKYMQEPLPEGFSIGEEIIPDDTPVQGISIGEEITYQASEGSELIPDYVNGIAEAMVKRKEALKGTIESYESKDSNILTGNLATAATGVGMGVDILTETAILGLKGISIIVPDAIEQPVIDTIKSSLKFIFETDKGKEGLESIKKGVGHWKKFENKYPEYAKIIGGFVNTALLFASPLKKAKLEPKSNTTMIGSKVIAPLESKAGKQLDLKITDRVKWLLAPERTPDRIQDIKNISIFGNDKGTKRSMFQVIQENEFELARNKLVQNIAGVKVKDSISNTANAVRVHNKKKAQTLMNDLDNTNISWNFPQGTQKELRARVDELLKDKNYIKANPNTDALVESTLKTAFREIALLDKTPAGLLRARQKFDKIINKQLSESLFDPAIMNPTNDAANAVRKAINDLVESRVSSTNVKVKQSLSEQHKLWNAQNILDIKAVNESSNRIVQIWQNINPLVDIQLAVNRTAAVTTGMGAFGAAQIFALPIAGTVVTGAAIWGLTQGALSISGKRALASTLTAIDKALDLTKSVKMINQLKLDRAYIIDLMKQPLTKEDESFAVN